METVKVDFQKLQQLNDRIAQTIEALNQVRLTTHGLQHSAAAMQQSQIPQQLVPQQFVPQQTAGIGYGQQSAGVGYGQQSAGVGYGQLPIGAQFSSMGPTAGFGIGHSMPMIDPYWQLRAAQQSFPFAAYSHPPVATNL